MRPLPVHFWEISGLEIGSLSNLELVLIPLCQESDRNHPVNLIVPHCSFSRAGGFQRRAHGAALDSSARIIPAPAEGVFAIHDW
jgi:hypothetical protein